MARVLSQTLTETLSRRFEPHLCGRRHNHTRRGAPKAELLELDASPSPSPEAAAAGVVAQKLEEAIEGSMARMAEPVWAPFRPGTSYWAPPRRAAGLGAVGLVALIKSGPVRAALSDDEARAVAAASRGWPCSAYFLDGQFPDELTSSRTDAASTEDEEN